MPSKKPKRKPTADRHRKDYRMVRIRGKLAERLDALATRNESNVTTEANRAVRELLEREKLWPPADER